MRRIAGLAALACVVATSGVHADPGQVYLVQASGWMDGYINNTGGAFQREIARLIELTDAPGWPIAVASFNRHKEALERGNDCSPRTVFPVESCAETATLAPWSPNGVTEALNRIRIPTNPRGGLANAFIDEALLRARAIHLGADPGIVWLITNNKNAPVGDLNPSEVADNTRSFMDALKNATDISAVVAVPIEMRAVSATHPRFGTHYGFIAYGIAYGSKGKELLQAVTSPSTFVEEFGRPFRIRPLDDEPLQLAIAPQTNDPAVHVTTDRDGRIQVTGVEIGRSVPLVLDAALENTLYPHVIHKASIRLAWQPENARPVGELGATIDPAEITDLGPREIRNVAITLDFAARTAPREASQLKTQAFVERGDLMLEVTGIELSQDPMALARLKTVFLGSAVNPAAPNAPDSAIPDIFLSGATLPRLDGRIPLAFKATVSPLGTLLDVVGIILLVVAVGLFYLQMKKSRRQSALIAGQRQIFSLRPLQTTRFRAPDGTEYIVKGSFFGDDRAKATPVAGRRT